MGQRKRQNDAHFDVLTNLYFVVGMLVVVGPEACHSSYDLGRHIGTLHPPPSPTSTSCSGVPVQYNVATQHLFLELLRRNQLQSTLAYIDAWYLHYSL